MMTSDRYTKAVLTVIAGCLVFQCAMTAGRAVEAQQVTPPTPPMIAAQGATPVIVVGWGEMNRSGAVVHVATKNSAAGMVTDPRLPVALPYTESARLPVALAAPVEVTVATPVHVASDPAAPIAVGITAVKKTGEWEPLRTAVEPQPSKKTPGGH